jgi:uncharacterized protein YecT (DUF1311 family)
LRDSFGFFADPGPSGRTGRRFNNGIDCKTAASTSAVELCASRDYRAADLRLNEAYRTVVASTDKADVPAEARSKWHDALVEARGSAASRELAMTRGSIPSQNAHRALYLAGYEVDSRGSRMEINYGRSPWASSTKLPDRAVWPNTRRKYSRANRIMQSRTRRNSPAR